MSPSLIRHHENPILPRYRDSLHIALSERDSDSSEALSENLVVDKAAGSHFGLIAHQSSSWVSSRRGWGRGSVRVT